MTKISEIIDQGSTYEFQPPVEVGLQNVSTLASLVRVAIRGSKVESPEIADMLERPVSSLLRTLDTPKSKAVALTAFLEGRHTVTVGKCTRS